MHETNSVVGWRWPPKRFQPADFAAYGDPLGEQSGNPELVLADHFDLFAGTSTGATIATCLCWERSFEAILELYFKFGRRWIPRSETWWLRTWAAEADLNSTWN